MIFKVVVTVRLLRNIKQRYDFDIRCVQNYNDCYDDDDAAAAFAVAIAAAVATAVAAAAAF